MSENDEANSMKFRQFIEAGVLTSKDFSAMPIQARMQQGKDIGENHIRNVLRDKYNIDIKPAQGYREDAVMKIDGYWNGEPVQIKLRRSTRDDRNDIAYELVRNHDPRKPVREELKDFHQQGRDYRGTSVKHYFVMNKTETAVYHVQAAALSKAVQVALDELDTRENGYLARPFSSPTNGVQLRPTRDPDPQSFTPSKVMAFIPVEKVSDQTYDITQKPSMVTAGAQQVMPKPVAPPPVPVSPPPVPVSPPPVPVSPPPSMNDIMAKMMPKKIPSLR